MFFVPRNSLQSGQSYSFRATIALSEDPDRQNTADILVRVRSAPLIVSIALGDRLFSLSEGKSLVMDGSLSHDPDFDTNTAKDTNLTVIWSCTVATGEADGTPCFSQEREIDFAFRSLSSATKTFTVSAMDLEPFALSGQTLLFTLALSKAARTAKHQVRIEVTTSSVPSVFISTSSDVANGNEPLRLVGSADFGTEKSFVYEWSVTSNNLDLDDTTKLLTSRTSKDLVIAADVLVPGATVTFQLLVRPTSSSTAEPGKATRTIKANRAPASGSCIANPPSGIAYTTSFMLQCTGWEDEDLPLSYEYKLERNGALVNLLVAEGSNKCVTELGPGVQSITAYIRDSWGAETAYKLLIPVDAALPDPEFESRALGNLEMASGTTKNINTFSQSFLALSSSLTDAKLVEVMARRRLLNDGMNVTTLLSLAASRAETRRQMANMLVELTSTLSVVTSSSLRQVYMITHTHTHTHSLTHTYTHTHTHIHTYTHTHIHTYAGVADVS
jgi:hypothetical protein